MKIKIALVVVFLFSLVVWLLVSVAGGGREAWDSGSYWSVGLPAIYLAGALAACASRVGVWLLGLWSGLGQLVGLALTASGFSMWPVGMVLLAVLTLPVVGLAALARWLMGRLSG